MFGCPWWAPRVSNVEATTWTFYLVYVTTRMTHHLGRSGPHAIGKLIPKWGWELLCRKFCTEISNNHICPWGKSCTCTSSTSYKVSFVEHTWVYQGHFEECKKVAPFDHGAYPKWGQNQLWVTFLHNSSKYLSLGHRYKLYTTNLGRMSGGF